MGFFLRDLKTIIYLHFWLGRVFIAVRRLSLVAVASLLSSCRAQALLTRDLIVVFHGLGCPTACEFFLDQRSNWYALHGQADSYLLDHQGSLLLLLLFFFLTPRHWALWDGHEEREVRMQSNLENFSLRINGLVEP